MALVETLHEQQVRVEDLRHHLGRVREALDQTDSILGAAEETLERAEVVIEQGRRALPAIAVGLVVVAVGVGVVVWLRRRSGDED
jgi:hypothetical protein